MPLVILCCIRYMQKYFASKQTPRHCAPHRKLRRLCACAGILLFIGLFVALVTPVRNVVAYPILPASWRPLSTLRILELFYVKEKIVSVENGEVISCQGVQETMASFDWSSLVNQLDKLPAYDDDYFRNVEERLEDLGESPLKAKELYKKYPSFMPPISGREQRELRLTFKVMTAAFDLFNISYILCEGSMLGAYRHHGFIPWDDDIDVCLNGTDWLRVKQILHCVPGFDVDTSHYMMYKFFWEGSRVQFSNDGETPSPVSPGPATNIVRVPYIDIFFYTEDVDYIWSMSPLKKHRLLYKKSDIFPLVWRPFENKMAPLPKDYVRMCNGKQYDACVCVSRDFDHMNKRALIPYYDYQYVSCERFKPIYPFVERRQAGIAGESVVIETLRLGNKILGEHVVLNL